MGFLTVRKALFPAWKGLQHSSNLAQSASCSYRRYATAPEHPAYKDGEEDAKPLAVKERRKPRHHHTKEGIDLPPLRSNPTMGDQLEDPLAGRKYNLRGIKDGEVVGTRIYLPNIIMRMVRNGTKPGEPYNPYQATFHVPVSITKNDIKSYLLAVYGVETTYINTEIPHQKGQQRGQPLKAFKPKPRFKRAIVGLVEPFYYPDDPADMSVAEVEEFEDEQTDRGLTVMRKMRKLASKKAMRLPSEVPGEQEDKLERKTRLEAIAQEVEKERRDSVTDEVMTQLASSPEERQINNQ
jgi:ribosomal protein L23